MNLEDVVLGERVTEGQASHDSIYVRSEIVQFIESESRMAAAGVGERSKWRVANQWV